MVTMINTSNVRVRLNLGSLSDSTESVDTSLGGKTASGLMGSGKLR